MSVETFIWENKSGLRRAGRRRRAFVFQKLLQSNEGFGVFTHLQTDQSNISSNDGLSDDNIN